MFYHSVMLIYGISSLLVFSEDGEPLTVNQKELPDEVGLRSILKSTKSFSVSYTTNK